MLREISNNLQQVKQ